jgi:pyruvate dehydrogenase E2 component (dihydrolipoamide acetyltransferase)
MATEIKLPDLGENIDSGTIVNILVAVGDSIVEEQGIVEVETDKAVIEMPSPAAGNVASINVADGDIVAVGGLVITLDSDAAATTDADPAPVPEPEAATEPESPDPPPAPKEVSTPPQNADQKPVAESPKAAINVPAAPSVRRLAREIGVDISIVSGSGPGGRISDEDVKAHAKAASTDSVPSTSDDAGESTPVAASSVATHGKALPDFAKWGEVEREKMSRLRVTVGENMAHAWQTIPHVTQDDHADITVLDQWRRENSAAVESEGGKLTVTAIALKIVAAALRKFPKFNASIDTANQEVVYKKYTNIGVAVDTDRGLVVPVIRNVDSKSLIELSIELTEIAGKARDGKLSLDEMQGGTFTITNLGGLGTTQFTPIVNWPQVAILGMSRGGMQPVWNKADEKFEPRFMLPLSISYDHRIIDGADAARFLRWIAVGFEKPLLMT